MKHRRLHAIVLATLVIALSAWRHGRAQQSALETAPDAAPARIRMISTLTIERVSGGGGRNPLATDAVQRSIIRGEWTTPKAGDEITLADGAKRVWREVAADASGRLPAEATRGGYALWLVDSPNDRVMLLNARGHGMAYVNGEPRAGDPYGYGIVSLPVKLKKGVNEILLHCSRGAAQAELVEPVAPVALSAADATLPDLVRGGDEDLWGAALVINATETPFKPLAINCEHAGGVASNNDVPAIEAMSLRKVAFRIAPLPEEFDDAAKTVRVVINMLGRGAADGAQVVKPLEIDLNIVDAQSLQKRTFISDIDGSVQYFAVRPSTSNDADNALILTLHGAGVEAHGQAAAYKSKNWAHVVAPTNRRPFGFDWEDWGRLDAIEVLDIAKSRLQHDPKRIYLTGHSMGGHGTWQIGSTFPGEFAAIAPSAGWISFETYGSGAARGGGRDGVDADADPLQSIMRRAGNASRTLDLQRNLEGVGAYILHGDADDNVPVQQARAMKEQLTPWHKDFAYHEQPGAGHWWGDECVDWPPLMEFLQAHERPEARDIDHVSFITASPGVSAQRDWAVIQQQVKAMQFSRIDLTRDLAARSIIGATENVARLAIDVGVFGDEEVHIEIDGQAVRARGRAQADAFVELAQRDGRWAIADGPLAPSHKTPARCGPFKAAFNHRFLLVYGTKGDAQENAWAISKARFDAETFWYRGNGSVDIVADVDFKPEDETQRDRSVILYGNADTNAAWPALLADSPVQARRGSITIGDRECKGDDLAGLFVRPRPGSDLASVGVVCGSGAIGQRITDRLPYFVSGVAYPDCIVIGGSDLARDALSIKAAGFFGNDWSVATGDFAWNQE